MQLNEFAFLSALVAAVLLIASAIWGERRYSSYAQLPAHFGITGKPTWFAPRSFVLWLIPVIFIFVIAVLGWSVANKGAGDLNQDPSSAIMTTSAIIIGVQSLILWLIQRWAGGEK